MPDNCLVVAFFCIDFHHGCLTACKGGYYGYAIFGNCHRAIFRDQFNSSNGIKNKGLISFKKFFFFFRDLSFFVQSGKYLLS